MVTHVHVDARIWNQEQCVVSRQPKYDSYVEEWKERMFSQLKTRQHYYFFVNERIDKKELKVKYCPSLNVLANFFTKPLQGQLFKKFRDVIMGYRSISDLIVKSFWNQGACWNKDLWLKNSWTFFLVTNDPYV